jgi:hypothetical protein
MKLNGSDYVVRAEHPRRGGPLRITDKAGRLIAVSGQRCTDVSVEHLSSMIANGYVERTSVERIAPVAPVEAAEKGAE